MIRQRAKAGLQRMDDMGQMGNSEEAVMPDDLPFSIEDLDMEDDGLEMAQGGVVSMANGGPVGQLAPVFPASSTALGTPVGQVGTPSLANIAPARTLGAPMGQLGTQVVVYGPDGTAYGNGAIAEAAGVFNYTMTPPTVPTAPATPAAPVAAGKAASPMEAASAKFQQLGGTKFTSAPVQTTTPTFQETIGRGVPYVDYDPNAPDETEQPETPAEVAPPRVQPNDTGGDGGGDGNGGGTGTSPSSTTSSLPSVLSLGNLFSGKTSKTGVKGESIFGSGVGVAEEYDPSKRSLSGLGALGMNPNTNFKNNMGEIGNALGIYGTDGVNVGAILGVATGSILTAAGAVSGVGPNINLGYKEAPKGFGSFKTEDLIAYTKNEISPQRMENLGINQMSKQQAMQRAQVQRQIGTTLTGRYGFSKGSIDPNTGLVYDTTGRAVNYNGNGTGVDNSFSTGKDWVDAVKASVETGYWGGPLSVQDFNKLSPEAKIKYNDKFEMLGHDDAQDGVGGESKSAETNISKSSEAGIGPTGRKSSTGRQDYSGGQSDGSRDDSTPDSTPDSPPDTGTDFGDNYNQDDVLGPGEEYEDDFDVDMSTSKSESSDDTGDTGCFITTAIVEKKGEADDGETLTKLRKFRNEYMADKQEEVQEYYEIAPKIVEAINDKKEWKWIEEQIQKAVDYIDEEKHDDAYTTYKSMVSTLKEKWLV